MTRAGAAVGGSTGTVPGLGIALWQGRDSTFLLGPGAVRNPNSWELIPYCCGIFFYSEGEAWLICVAGFATLLA